MILKQHIKFQKLNNIRETLFVFFSPLEMDTISHLTYVPGRERKHLRLWQRLSHWTSWDSPQPPLQPDQVPLDGAHPILQSYLQSYHSVWYHLQTSWECFSLWICSSVSDEDIKKHWSQYTPLRDTTCYPFEYTSNAEVKCIFRLKMTYMQVIFQKGITRKVIDFRSQFHY